MTWHNLSGCPEAPLELELTPEQKKRRTEVSRLIRQGRVRYCSGAGGWVVSNPPEVSRELKRGKCEQGSCPNCGHCHLLNTDD